jgi:hypothetical protein
MGTTIIDGEVMCVLSIETVETLIKIAGHRIAAEVANEATLALAMSKVNVSEPMRIKACGEAGHVYSEAIQVHNTYYPNKSCTECDDPTCHENPPQ